LRLFNVKAPNPSIRESLCSSLKRINVNNYSFVGAFAPYAQASRVNLLKAAKSFSLSRLFAEPAKMMHLLQISARGLGLPPKTSPKYVYERKLWRPKPVFSLQFWPISSSSALAQRSHDLFFLPFCASSSSAASLSSVTTFFFCHFARLRRQRPSQLSHDPEVVPSLRSLLSRIRIKIAKKSVFLFSFCFLFFLLIF
jgi:hypothetical protein